jgi:hypothetical protein
MSKAIHKREITPLFLQKLKPRKRAIQELGDRFVGNASFRLPREFNGAILTLCGGGQQHKLAIRKRLR